MLDALVNWRSTRLDHMICCAAVWKSIVLRRWCSASLVRGGRAAARAAVSALPGPRGPHSSGMRPRVHTAGRQGLVCVVGLLIV